MSEGVLDAAYGSAIGNARGRIGEAETPPYYDRLIRARQRIGDAMVEELAPCTGDQCTRKGHVGESLRAWRLKPHLGALRATRPPARTR
jgi:hypothetical protein